MTDTQDIPSEQNGATEEFRDIVRRIPHIEDPVDLMDAISAALNLMLRREAERALLDAFSVTVGEIIASLPFDGTEKELRAATRQAAHDCLTILKEARAARKPRDEESEPLDEDMDAVLIDEMLEISTADEEGPGQDGGAPEQAGEDTKENDDIEYFLPPELAHLLKHLEYEIPQPERIERKFNNFDDWFHAAILCRINRVLTFFQRHNPQITRELPPPFLLSPHFAKRFSIAVEKLIFPSLRTSRQLRLLASSIDYEHADIDTFWDSIDTTLRDTLPMVWATGWDAITPVEVNRDGDHVLQLKSGTKELRELLHPESPGDYDMPRIGVREIEIFKSLLDPAIDWWPQLNTIWNDFHVLYEQEMDPRVFQQQAREGALRDYILAAEQTFPEQWGDFMVLLCHRVFPRINSTFLDMFVRNLGQDEAARTHRMPYLMRYLKQIKDNPTIKRREKSDEAQWEDQVEQLRNYLKGRRKLPR